MTPEILPPEEMREWGGYIWPESSWDDPDCQCDSLENHTDCPVHGHEPWGGQLKRRYINQEF